jgi:hypothetical protein
MWSASDELELQTLFMSRKCEMILMLSMKESVQYANMTYTFLPLVVNARMRYIHAWSMPVSFVDVIAPESMLYIGILYLSWTVLWQL